MDEAQLFPPGRAACGLGLIPAHLEQFHQINYILLVKRIFKCLVVWYTYSSMMYLANMHCMWAALELNALTRSLMSVLLTSLIARP